MSHELKTAAVVRAGVHVLGPGPVVMGILNVTPDSFSDGGEFFEHGQAVTKALKMLREGAQVIDVGGESTRPGSDPVSPEEELRRVVPVIQEVSDAWPEAIISVDTYRASTAEAALEAGAAVINDVTALRGDPRMAAVVADAGCPVILMHMQGEPKTMQLNPRYQDVVKEIRDFLLERVESAVAAGIDPGKIILDPGIGFGKRIEHNLTLLNHLGMITEAGFPVLVGASRKAFLGLLTGADVKGRVFGTVAANVLAYERGANWFRVHDVQANREALAVAAAIQGR